MRPEEFLPRALQAAKDGEHIFPEYAVCEAALESAWGESLLARKGNNLFGQKHGREQYPTVSIPTHEEVAGKLVSTSALWPMFPDWATSFKERMALLHRVRAYGPALLAKDGESFIKLVSPIWASDHLRGDKVLAIYRKHYGI